MEYISDFIRKYANVSFYDMPFCDADNIALCGASYIPIEKVVSADFDAEPLPYREACDRYFAYTGYKHVPIGLVLTKAYSIRLMNMSRTKRYSEMKIVACTESFGEYPALQFGAATYLLPDGKIVVVYRGTDDTLVGWKEDLDIYTKKGIPSQPLGVEYLEKVAAKFDGDIIVCGHSKGGNVAQYSALNCSEETRKRIVKLYNNDGPGFFNWDFLETKAYADLLPNYKHYVPQASLVGMLLAHDDDYTVVKSKMPIGPLQHDLSTWGINGTTPVTCKDLNKLGKITDLVFYRLFFGVDGKQAVCFDKVMETVMYSTGQRGLLGFSKHIPSSIKNAAAEYKKIDSETKEVFGKTFSAFGSIVKDAVIEVSKGKFETVKERAAKYVPKF